MNYELEAIESLINNVVQDHPLEKNKLENWVLALNSEKERIKLAFTKEVFSLKKERLIEVYIQQNQEAVIRLLDKVTHFINDNSDVSKAKFKNIKNALEDVLGFIEQHFSKYFNLDANVPVSYRSSTASEIKLVLPEIEEGLHKKGFENRILILAIAPLKDFTSDVKVGITYHHMIYLKGLCSELQALLLSEENTGVQLYFLLGYLNFNSVKFFNHCIDRIDEYANETDTLTGRLERMAYILKRINQAQVKPGYSLEKGHPPLKDQLVLWVAEEIIFLERRHQLSFPFVSHQKEIQRPKIKLDSTLSVPQLAFFFKILTDLEVIKPKNSQELIRFASDSFKTKKVESISPDSFRSKFYNTEPGAVKVIKELSIKMMNHITKNYRP